MAAIKILDHGYVEVVESWGSDQAIIEAARMSTQKGFLGWGPECVECRCNTYDKKFKAGDRCPACGMTLVHGDEKLLAFLWDNGHATPFEFAGLVIEVRAPIIVFREWHRHRTQSYNEASARYAALPAIDYLPTVDRVMRKGAGKNKQAMAKPGATELTPDVAQNWLFDLERWREHGEHLYQHGLAAGVPKELARLAMSVGRYSTMRAHANLRNWLAFVKLRDDENAMVEIQLYAKAVGTILEEKFPRSWGLFQKGRGR